MDRLEAWTIFVAVAEHESFAEAARRLNRSPAAVTRAISALEDDLSTRLLNRTTRSVSLTEAGIKYFDGCRRLLQDIERLDSVTQEDNTELKGSIHVTSAMVFGRTHVVPLVQEFLELHPQVDIKILLQDRNVSLVDEGVDVGFRFGHLPDSTLRATRVGYIRRRAFVTPDYLDKHGTPRHPNDLGNHKTIVCTAVTPIQDRLTFGADHSLTVAVQPRLIISSPEAAVASVMSGFGIGVLLSYPFIDSLAKGTITTVLNDFEPAPIPVNIVYAAGRHLPGRIRSFITFASEKLRTQFEDTQT